MTNCINQTEGTDGYVYRSKEMTKRCKQKRCSPRARFGLGLSIIQILGNILPLRSSLEIFLDRRFLVHSVNSRILYEGRVHNNEAGRGKRQASGRSYAQSVVYISLRNLSAMRSDPRDNGPQRFFRLTLGVRVRQQRHALRG